MSSKPLKETLQRLQCHFTWNFEIKDKVEENHILQVVDLRLKHTLHPNRSTFLAMKAYLLYLQGRFKEALSCLKDAEGILRREHPKNFARHVLLLYGDFAWIYYRLTNYDMVERYLDRICEICHSLGSPEPYSVSIPELHSQKGWSLLVGGFRNGKEAKQCFQVALEGDEESNEEFQVGLAIAAFACCTHDWNDEVREEAKQLLEKVVPQQPQNYEIKVSLAKVLRNTESQRISHLLKDVVQNSLNPEDLRNAAKVCRQGPWSSLPWAISILKQAIALDPSYHLVYYDLGVCYREQMERVHQGEKADLLKEAMRCFKQALEEDPGTIYPRLELAKLYGKSSLAHEEEIYQNLLEELPAASKRCQQAIYLHWGDFLLHKKGQKQKALEMYKACYKVAGDHPLEQKRLVERLRFLAGILQEDAEMETVRSLLEALRGPSGAGFSKRRSTGHPSGRAWR